MAHVDDGKLNALLDGELNDAEAAAIRSHVATCADCGRRLDQAKRFLEAAADVLGEPEPASPPAAQPRPSRTAKEVALDLDGVTQKSPAIGPSAGDGSAGPLFRGRPPRRPFDYTSVAWAATIALAIGVGFLADEVLQGRTATRLAATARPAGEGGGTQGTAGPTTQSPGPAVPAPAAPTPSTGPVARRPALPAPKTLNPRGPTTVLGHKQLAERSRVALPPAAASRSGRAARAARADSVPPAPPPAFRRITMEQAVDQLGGAIRLIDGMRSTRVEVGPGSLVAGARPDAAVVRVVYVEGGMQITLDQQRAGGASDSTTTGAPAPSAAAGAAGMSPGDTAFSTAPDGTNSMRWVDDRDFRLSLVGRLPPESLRRLAARVR